MNPEEIGVVFPEIPNLYRCETCLNKSCEYFRHREIWCTDGSYIGSAAAITWEVGCTSHSLFRSDLDNIIRWMEQFESHISEANNLEDYKIAWYALRIMINSFANGGCKL